MKNLWFLCLLDCHGLIFLGQKNIEAKLINLFFSSSSIFSLCVTVRHPSPETPHHLSLSYILYLSSSLISFVSSSSFLFQYSYSVYITVRHLSPEAPHHITSSFIFVFFSLFVSSSFSFFYLSFSFCCYILSAQQWDITPLGPLHHSILSLQKIPSTSKEPLKLLVGWFSVTLSLIWLMREKIPKYLSFLFYPNFNFILCVSLNRQLYIWWYLFRGKVHNVWQNLLLVGRQTN